MTLKMFNDFEHGAENIRSWLDLVEGNLQKQQLTNDLPAYQQFIAVSHSFPERDRQLIVNL